MSKSSIWDSFEKSDYAKGVVAALDKKAKEEKVAPPSAPGPLEGVGWQKGNGHIPDVTKTHDIKETHTAVENLAKKAPTGKVAATLVRLVKIAEVWENQVAAGNEKLVPFVAELDSIIDSTMAEYTTASVDSKKK